MIPSINTWNPEHTPNNGYDNKWWLDKHQKQLESIKSPNTDILFLGDSIIDHFSDVGKEIWDKYFTNCLNFGISSDRIQHLYWRLLNLKEKSIELKPKYIVILIGTNNTGLENYTGKHRNTNEEIIEGYRLLFNLIKNMFPFSKILFYSLFPRQDKTKQQFD